MPRLAAPLSALTLVAAVALSAHPAAAGNGVRLNFGGPLGSFVATPTPGYGSSAYVVPRKAVAKPQKAIRKLEVASPQPRAKRVMARADVPVHDAAPSDPAPRRPVTAATNEQVGFLGKTLASNQLPRAEIAKVVEPTDLIVATEVADNSVSKAPASPVSQKASTPEKSDPASALCRRFIPAVGETVTVACD